jgi:nucleotide-binding universal stress UspA family protein
MNRILVGLDASQHSQQILRAAVAVAQRTGGKLVLLRAVTLPVDLPSSILGVSPESALSTMHEEAKRQIEALAATAPPGIVESARVRIGGAPWEAICDEAREDHANLIIIGSHGYRGIDRILGTTAAKVVNHADRSVLVVRSPELLEI